MEKGVAAPLRPLVMRVRVTVTGLVTGASMTVTRAAGEIWCVDPITASSSVHTITKRMTAVRDLQ